MQLQNLFSSYHKLSEDEIELIAKNINLRQFKPNETFLKSGIRSNEIGFVNSGVFRYYSFDKKGNEVTSFFMSENEFVGNVSSFFEYIPSTGTIEAITECEIVVISRKSWELFCAEIPHWENTFQKIINDVLIKKTDFQRSLINSDAKSSYLKFLNTFPNISKRTPLIYIASFLGITPFSLSRIRKAIASL
ncbi:Crp/Fnr family transcriptional regulator [Cellulophaga baltica]|uniref:Crp/Fnr family transcriptional regulator n=1 Tax=Cellulophaga baltica TaxID=76594 RepID=UPI0021494EBA|nr:Crp/Fnr family transcriptional regulator [Cellulophaga baltica]MCR1027075.1 Crp/Fnr family transcriptional regulator [Cellulophaga baltica]